MISSPQLIEAESIGSIVIDSQSIPREGTILGKTSRGIFIKSASKWLVFISSEAYRGPITINLIDNQESLQGLSSNMPVQISPAGFTFPDLGLEISTRTAQTWRPRNADAPAVPRSERQSRLENTSERILQKVSGSGLSSLLPDLVESSDSSPSSTKNHSHIDEIILTVQKELFAPNHLPNAETVKDLLGAGSGLTPSGDDFILGLLLALNRWKSVLVPFSDLESLNQQVVSAAYNKTTTLSANLIECATRGLANERLIAALDWLMAGNARDSHAIEELLSWGNSSGADVFVGFAASLSLPQRYPR